MPVRSYIQGFHCFLNRSFVVKTVNDIQIQIICSQPFQCTVNLSVNGFCRQIAKILLRIILCLRIPKLIVFAVAIDKQIGMAALLDDCTLMEHGDLVTKFAGGQPVRNEIRPPVY